MRYAARTILNSADEGVHAAVSRAGSHDHDGRGCRDRGECSSAWAGVTDLAGRQTSAELLEEVQSSAGDQGGRLRVVRRQAPVGEQVRVTGVHEELGALRADDPDQL